jgi:polyvinyl alcohol dehydrogenase (cytochrome)
MSRDGRLTAYFADWSATVYAVDAGTGMLLWKTKIEDHPLAKISSSPTLSDGRLYVGVASGEEGEAGNPAYECCTFRGSVVSLDAATGRQMWKTYLVADTPARTGKNARGTIRWGPSGAAVWSAPTVDVRQRAAYVATGNNYSPPATPASDAVVALEMDSGKIRWIRQLTADDTWNTSCQPRVPGHENCPDLEDPDFDFGASAILVEVRDGRRMLVAGQKSGLVYGLDPDQRGTVMWQQRVGKGGTQGGVLWGPAVDHDTVYVAVSDAMRVGATTDFDPKAGGGLVAIDLATGQKRWTAPPVPCRDQHRSCSPAQVAAVSVIPGVVFSGSADGHLRAYSTRDGAIIWDYDTVRDFETVNGIKGKGGTINNGGVAVVDGMVFTNSGYHHITGIYPGNVLLAFTVE